MSEQQDIKDLLDRRDKIMVYARAGEADAFHPNDAVELDRIGQQLADLGIHDDDLTLETYEASLSAPQSSSRVHPTEFGRRQGGSFAADQDGASELSANKGLWDRVSGMLGLGKGKAHDEAFQRRLDKIAAERTADLDGLDQS